MARAKTKVKKRTSRTTPVAKKRGIDQNSFLLIVGGGFVVVLLAFFLMH